MVTFFFRWHSMHIPIPNSSFWTAVPAWSIPGWHVRHGIPAFTIFRWGKYAWFGKSITLFQGIGFLSFQYCASFFTSGRSVAIDRWHDMHFSTDGMFAYWDLFAEEWQKRQESLWSVTWTLWEKAIGCGTVSAKETPAANRSAKARIGRADAAKERFRVIGPLSGDASVRRPVPRPDFIPVAGRGESFFSPGTFRGCGPRSPRTARRTEGTRRSRGPASRTGGRRPRTGCRTPTSLGSRSSTSPRRDRTQGPQGTTRRRGASRRRRSRRARGARRGERRARRGSPAGRPRPAGRRGRGRSRRRGVRRRRGRALLPRSPAGVPGRAGAIRGTPRRRAGRRAGVPLSTGPPAGRSRTGGWRTGNTPSARTPSRRRTPSSPRTG